jgi:hypothetical protein
MGVSRRATVQRGHGELGRKEVRQGKETPRVHLGRRVTEGFRSANTQETPSTV